MKSMTGFGGGEATGSRGKIQVEVKSFNHRFLEIRLRLPRIYQGFESRLYQWLKNRIERGRVEVLVQAVEYDKHISPVPIMLNRRVVEGYINLARQLKDEYKVQGELDVKTLLSLHDVFQPSEDIESNEEDWIPVLEATEKALEAMGAMQKQEGDAISADLEGRIGVMESRLAEIEEIAKDLPEQFRERLERRLSHILQVDGMDPQRIAEEVVVYADKSDITEEIVRIRSHLKQLWHSVSTCFMPGKRLEFLVQEIHREVNTIGTKSQEPRITHLAVDIKMELEKIREQAQNLL
jgi:uncharacterized protein (TIGR00255 family)